MKIAQIAPLSESVPPRLYGGTERVVAWLTDELVRAGHDVTLFASGDSETLAKLEPVCERALRLSPRPRDAAMFNSIMLGRVLRRAHEFDILHAHLDYFHMPALLPFADRTLTTQHGRMDLPDLPAVFAEFPEMAMVSISDAQRVPAPLGPWSTTIYHGLPRDLHRVGDGSGGYLAFLGRICPEKGIERAIAIARATGVPLKIAAKIDAVDRQYYERHVHDLIDGKLIQNIGEIGEREKTAFLGNARALLFPIAWPEPFGLVLIEAMACGTPVIAWSEGSVPEIVESGVTGFIASTVDEAAAAVGRLPELNRAVIRERFETRFSADRMAASYVREYEALLARRPMQTATLGAA